MVRNQLLGLSVGLAAAVVSFAQAHEPIPAPAQPVEATLDARKVNEPISKYDYGMFIEHLSRFSSDFPARRAI